MIPVLNGNYAKHLYKKLIYTKHLYAKWVTPVADHPECGNSAIGKSLAKRRKIIDCWLKLVIFIAMNQTTANQYASGVTT